MGRRHSKKRGHEQRKNEGVDEGVEDSFKRIHNTVGEENVYISA